MPQNSVILPNNSAKMQPIDQISIDFVYSDEDKIISGARYHRVTT